MSIFYKELLIVDKKEKLARKILFHKGINIITSKDNSVGKTSLSLMLLHSFGAKVKFSSKWNLDDIFTKLTVVHDNKEIIIIRYKNSYTIKTEEESFFYPLQKCGYSDKLYELLGLTIKIKDKNADTYSTAVPSLYLLPYFLPQTNSENDRSIFEDLSMYSKLDLYDALYYHVGALDNQYSNTVQELTKIKLSLETLKKSKEKQLLEIGYLEEKLKDHKNVKTVENDIDLESDLTVYKKYAEKNQEYYALIKRKTDIKHQIKLLNKTLSDNEVYTIKLLNEEEIRCPVCKADISDFISSALTLGMAETDVNAELAQLKAELLNIERQLAQIRPKLDAFQSEIAQIEEARNNIKITRAILVWNEELQLVKNKFATTQLQIEKYEKTIKELQTKIRIYNDKKKQADSSYRTSFSYLLDITNVDKHGIDIASLNLYDSVTLSGSEIPRVAISRFFALLESKNKDSIVMPIIFDFPNLDMTEENISKCFAVMCDLIKDTNAYPQSFIFSIDCLERISMAGRKLEDAHIIDMAKLPVDDVQHATLLCKKDFADNATEIYDMLK